jgi:hypothetical protein
MHPAQVLELLSAQQTQIRSLQERDAFVRILAGIEWHDEDYYDCKWFIVRWWGLEPGSPKRSGAYSYK